MIWSSIQDKKAHLKHNIKAKFPTVIFLMGAHVYRGPELQDLVQNHPKVQDFTMINTDNLWLCG
jgi:hypothetical protein